MSGSSAFDDAVLLDAGLVWRQAWGEVRPGYLDAATMGIPTVRTRIAMADALGEWADGAAVAAGYGDSVERARAAYARLVGVPRSEVAIGATTSELVALVAASLPDGAEVLCVDGDFSSMVYPFLQHAHRGVTVRHVALEALAEAIGPRTALVSFSFVQSADGRVADAEAIVEAARRQGVLMLCDTTQAAGVLPVDATRFDFTVCHSYKWLCAPRGAAFLTVPAALLDTVRPLAAGWYAGEDVWASTYGPWMALAVSARRFDTSPAWLSWVGAAVAIEHFATVDMAAAWERTTGIADELLAVLGLPPRGQAIVALDDPDGALAAALGSSGVRFSNRAGRVRLGIHVWVGDEDVRLVTDAFARAGLARVAA